MTHRTYGLVIVRDTEKDAKDAFQSIIDHGDWGAAGNVMKVAGMESQSFNEQIKKFQERFIAGWAGYPVVGPPDQVVEELGRLNEAGMDGMIMGFRPLGWGRWLGFARRRVRCAAANARSARG